MTVLVVPYLGPGNFPTPAVPHRRWPPRLGPLAGRSVPRSWSALNRGKAARYADALRLVVALAKEVRAASPEQQGPTPTTLQVVGEIFNYLRRVFPCRGVPSSYAPQIVVDGTKISVHTQRAVKPDLLVLGYGAARYCIYVPPLALVTPLAMETYAVLRGDGLEVAQATAVAML